MKKVLVKKFSLIIYVTVFMFCISPACLAAVVEYTDEASFIAGTGSPQHFIDFETYGDGTPVDPGDQPITGDEWLDDFGIQFDGMEVEHPLLLSTKDNMNVSPTHSLTVNGLSPGDDNASQLISFSTPVVSFGVYIIDNETTSSNEKIILKDDGGSIIDEFGMPFGGSGEAFFRGYLSDIPIAELHFIEDSSDNETMFLDNVMYTPEPVTLLLFGLGGLMLHRRKK